MILLIQTQFSPPHTQDKKTDKSVVVLIEQIPHQRTTTTKRKTKTAMGGASSKKRKAAAVAVAPIDDAVVVATTPPSAPAEKKTSRPAARSKKEKSSRKQKKPSRSKTAQQNDNDDDKVAPLTTRGRAKTEPGKKGGRKSIFSASSFSNLIDGARQRRESLFQNATLSPPSGVAAPLLLTASGSMSSSLTSSSSSSSPIPSRGGSTSHGGRRSVRMSRIFSPPTARPSRNSIVFHDFYEIKFSDVVLGKKLGAGNFGDVFAGTLFRQDIALKMLKRETLEAKSSAEKVTAKKEFEAELKLLRSLRHPNIVEFLGSCRTSDQMCIITELCSNGSIEDAIKVELPRARALKFAKDIARGVNWLHHRGIIHRDIKPSNLLLDEHWTVKVADFGR
jgi:hypothetical protein